MEKLISVIVPVYNVEHYLGQCVDSIVRQTYRNLEIILVDDGSTDRSGKICDEFALLDSRIKVVHKENGGNTSARKKGIEISSGNYLAFVDSDDWLELNMYEVLLGKAAEFHADVVRCAMVLEPDAAGRTAKDHIPPGVYSTESERSFLYKNIVYYKRRGTVGINRTLCPQLTSRRVLDAMYCKMGNDIQYGEDFAYAVLTVLRAETICITDTVLYHYRMREGSITHSSNLLFYAQVNSLYLFLKNVFEQHEDKEILMDQLEKYMDDLVITGLNHRFIIPRKSRIPDYMFPAGKIPPGARIIIYGAGAVGQSYLSQFRAEKLYTVAGWADRNWKKYREEGMDVGPAGLLKEMECDYVVIAVKEECVSREISGELRELYGIEDRKIVWERPVPVLDYFAQ